MDTFRKERTNDMINLIDQAKQLYAEKKGSDPLMLHHKCDLALDVHRKSAPDTKMYSLSGSCDNDVAVFDIALITGAVVAVSAVLCTVCSLLRCLRRR